MNDLSAQICHYISENWIGDQSNRAFATDHNIDEKTVRLIKDASNNGYKMTLETLEKICQAREISLAEFFRGIKR